MAASHFFHRMKHSIVFVPSQTPDIVAMNMDFTDYIQSLSHTVLILL